MKQPTFDGSARNLRKASLCSGLTLLVIGILASIHPSAELDELLDSSQTCVPDRGLMSFFEIPA